VPGGWGREVALGAFKFDVEAVVLFLDAAMDNSKLLKTGVIGTCVAAVCCFTSALVVLVSAVGMSAIIG